MAVINRGFGNRRGDSDLRLPPGQTLVDDWPALTAGLTPISGRPILFDPTQTTDRFESQAGAPEPLDHLPNGYTCDFMRPHWVLPRRLRGRHRPSGGRCVACAASTAQSTRNTQANGTFGDRLYGRKARGRGAADKGKRRYSMKIVSGLVGIVAGTLFAAVVGLAGPAQADDRGVGNSGRDRDSNYYGRDRSNNPWINQLVPTVKVPQVDTRVRN